MAMIRGEGLPKSSFTTIARTHDGNGILKSLRPCSLFVWTVDGDSTVHRATVTISGTTGNYVSISSGLNIGQRVVTEGYQKLSENTKVVF